MQQIISAGTQDARYNTLLVDYQRQLRQHTLDRCAVLALSDPLLAMEYLDTVRPIYNCAEFDEAALEYISLMTVSITQLPVLDDSNPASFNSNQDVMHGSWNDVNGKRYHDALRLWVVDRQSMANQEYIIYDLSGSYTILTGCAVLSSETAAGGRAHIQIYLDDVQLYSSSWIQVGSEPVPFNLAVTGGQQLKILCYTDSSSHTYCIVQANVCRYGTADNTPVQETERPAIRNQHIAAGKAHSVYLTDDGRCGSVGSNRQGQCDIRLWQNIISISAGDYHTVGLRSDGTVLATGQTKEGQCDVSGWKNIVAISAGDYHTVGLRSDGALLATGWNTHGQCDVSRLNNGKHEVIQLAAGYEHTAVLYADGTVAAIGSNEYDQCDVSWWTDIVGISTGTYHTVGVRSDGTVIAVGSNDQDQCNVSEWKDIVAVYAGDYFTMGVKKDGTVVAVGENDHGQCNISAWKNVVEIAAGGSHAFAITASGQIYEVGDSSQGQLGFFG